jgi:hypothetical protein
MTRGEIILYLRDKNKSLSYIAGVLDYLGGSAPQARCSMGACQSFKKHREYRRGYDSKGSFRHRN